MQPPNYTSLLHHAKSICFKVSSSLPLLPALQMNEQGSNWRGEIFAKKRRELAERTPFPLRDWKIDFPSLQPRICYVVSRGKRPTRGSRFSTLKATTSRLNTTEIPQLQHGVCKFNTVIVRGFTK